MMSFDPLLDAVPEDNFSVDAEAKKLEGKEKEGSSAPTASAATPSSTIPTPTARSPRTRRRGRRAPRRPRSRRRAPGSTGATACSPRSPPRIALGEPLAASVSPEDAYAHAAGLAVAQEGIDYSLGGEKESLTDVRKRMEAQAAAPCRIVPRGKGEKDDASFEKRLEVVSELKNATLVLPQLPGGKETNLQYSMRLDAQRKSARPSCPSASTRR